jgi:hypothetical protein
VRWILEGDGSLTPNQQTDDDQGVFNTLLQMPSQTGSEATVKAILDNGETIDFASFKVIPGVPNSIVLSSEGAASLLGVGEQVVTATIRDGNGNLVADGTRAVASVSGSALQQQTVPYTIDGMIETTLTGSEFVTDDNEFSITAGDVTKSEPFDISRLNVEVISILSELEVGTMTSVQVRVTDASSNKLSGIELVAFSTYGLIEDTNAPTDANGVATFVIQSPNHPGAATFSVRAGFSSIDQVSYEVVDSREETPTSGPMVNTREALVVGDQTQDGFLDYKRFDGLDIEIDYPATGFIQVSGDANSTVDISLGDILDPNMSPAVAFSLNSTEEDIDGSLIANDTTGIFPADLLVQVADEVTGELIIQPLRTNGAEITVADSHPMGVGSSYKFTKTSHLNAGNVNSLQRNRDYGFRVEVNPSVLEYGTIFSYGEAYKLTIDSTGRVQYQIQTENGVQTLDSAANLIADQWNTVAGQYKDGVLNLHVNGDTVSLAVADNETIYTDTEELIIADGFTGLISGAKFYNLRFEQLLAFGESGTQSTLTVTLDNTGKARVPVRSLGKLNAGQLRSDINIHRVAVTIPGGRDYVSLLSSEQYLGIGSYYVDHIRSDRPDYLDANIGSKIGANQLAMSVLPMLMPSAHAVSFSDVGSWLWSGVNWIIPLEDIGFLTQQLYYLATGNPKFNPVELSLAAIGTLTLIPLAKPLKVVVGPLRNIIRRVDGTNPRFVIAFGSVIGRTVQKAWDTKTFKVLLDILPFMIIAGELASDEESRKGLLTLIETVKSDTDLLAWIEYLGLPANGWEGNVEPPSVGLTASVFNSNQNSFELIAQKTAHRLLPVVNARTRPAKPSSKGARASKAVVTRLLRNVGRIKIDSPVNRAKVIDGVKGVSAALKNTDLASLRRAAFSTQTLRTSITIGQTAMKKLYRRAQNLRISPFAIAAMIAYLEDRKTCVDSDDLCEPLPPLIARKLESEFYKKIFTDSFIAGKKDFVGGFENGPAFHMAVMVFYQLSYEAKIGQQPIDIEKQIEIPLYENKLTDKTFGTPYQRRIDVILEGNGDEDDVTLVETKSYKRPFDPKRFSTWNLSRGKDLVSEDKTESKAVHKQFYLDRLAAFASRSDRRLAADIKWWFHQFNRKTIDGYTKSEVTKAFKALKKIPTGKLAETSLGSKTGSIRDGELQSKINTFSVKKAILENFKNQLFQDVEDAVYNELIINTKHDTI